MLYSLCFMALLIVLHVITLQSNVSLFSIKLIGKVASCMNHNYVLLVMMPSRRILHLLLPTLMNLIVALFGMQGCSSC